MVKMQCSLWILQCLNLWTVDGTLRLLRPDSEFMNVPKMVMKGQSWDVPLGLYPYVHTFWTCPIGPVNSTRQFCPMVVLGPEMARHPFLCCHLLARSKDYSQHCLLLEHTALVQLGVHCGDPPALCWCNGWSSQLVSEVAIATQNLGAWVGTKVWRCLGHWLPGSCAVSYSYQSSRYFEWVGHHKLTWNLDKQQAWCIGWVGLGQVGLGRVVSTEG